MEITLKNRLELAFINEHKKLGNYIKSRINSIEEAEDILQDVFYQALDNINSLQSVDNLAGYLYTIARNKITDWYRKKRLKTVSLHGGENENILEEIIEDVCINIEDDYIKSLVLDEVIRAIDDLPEEQKKVFTANEIDGVSFREMSEKTGISINTLLARKRYAVLNLKNKLKYINEIINED